MEAVKFLTPDELSNLQRLNQSFTRIKLRIADIELEKAEIVKSLDGLREEFSLNEKILIGKYGEDAVINMATGEVTRKKPQQ